MPDALAPIFAAISPEVAMESFAEALEALVNMGPERIERFGATLPQAWIEEALRLVERIDRFVEVPGRIQDALRSPAKPPRMPCVPPRLLASLAKWPTSSAGGAARTTIAPDPIVR